MPRTTGFRLVLVAAFGPVALATAPAPDAGGAPERAELVEPRGRSSPSQEPGVEARAAPALSLDELFATPRPSGVTPSHPVWSPDGRRFAFTWNADGMPQRELWVASADGSGLRRLPAGSDDAVSVRDFAWLADGSTIISLRGDELWSTALEDGDSAVLAHVGDGASHLRVSPDGRQAAWLAGGDLWLFDLRERSAPEAATDTGIPALSASPGRYSRPEREIGPGIWSGPTYAWSPDGRYIAVHYVDRRDLRQVPFPDYLSPETAPNPVRRGYPGDANESRTVGLLDVAARELRLLELPDPTAHQVVDFSWSPDGVLLVDVASDTNVDRWLYTVRPAEGRVNTLWHSRRSSRIYTAFASAWHAHGEEVVFLSDIGDRYGLYSVAADGGDTTPRLLTDPDYDVLSAPHVIASTGEIFYSANGNSPHEQHVYRVDGGGGEPRRLTDLAGQNTGFPSPDGRHVVILHSNDTTPPELYVTSAQADDAQRTAVGDDGARRVTRSPSREFAERGWVRPRYVSFPSQIDGYELHARILEPPDLDPARQYPVVFGPVYSNTVRNRWGGNYGLVQQLLVNRGYIVVQVDVRGSTGYGRDFREAFLADFAGDDIEDLASAVSWLRSLPYVDAQRFGIWGSSYGGTLTVYTLLKKPGLFCAGVAAAPAVDPYFFGTDDVAIVRRPSTRPEIFQHAARHYAASLEDHLMLMHGMQDQVVPFKTTAVLAEAFIRHDRDFDLVVAPGATHAWSREPDYARFLFGKLIGFFDRHLLAAGSCEAPDGVGPSAAAVSPSASVEP